MSTFQDASEDHEVRITAYLAMMTCPSDAALNAVRSVLKSEEVGQVRDRLDAGVTRFTSSGVFLGILSQKPVSDKQMSRDIFQSPLLS